MAYLEERLSGVVGYFAKRLVVLVARSDALARTVRCATRLDRVAAGTEVEPKVPNDSRPGWQREARPVGWFPEPTPMTAQSAMPPLEVEQRHSSHL